MENEKTIEEIMKDWEQFPYQPTLQDRLEQIRDWFRFRRIRQFVHNVKRVIYWLPLIWEDRWFDSVCLCKLIKHKLDYDSEKYLKFGIAVGSEQQAKQMKLCSLLLERLINDEYNTLPNLCRKNSRRSHFQTPIGWSSYWDYEAYMKKQDIELLTKTIQKNLLNWWD